MKVMNLMSPRMAGITLAVLMVAVALPQTGAHHTPPDGTKVNVGMATCVSPAETTGAFSNPAFNGIIRVTDNGVLSITAGAQSQIPGVHCRVRVSFPGTFSVHGARPEGGLEPPTVVGVCTAIHLGPCTTSPAQTGWWVTFMDARGKATITIQIDYRVTVSHVTTVAGSEVEREVAFFRGFVEITEPSVPELTVPGLDAVQGPELLLPQSSVPAPDVDGPEGALVFAHAEPQQVAGKGDLGAQTGLSACRVNYQKVGQYAYWFRAADPVAGCMAGTASVLCCSYLLSLGVTEGFQGTAQVRAEFSSGGVHAFKCTWAAAAVAGTLGASCTSERTGLVYVGDTLVSLKGEAAGRSNTGAWSMVPRFESPI